MTQNPKDDNPGTDGVDPAFARDLEISSRKLAAEVEGALNPFIALQQEILETMARAIKELRAAEKANDTTPCATPDHGGEDHYNDADDIDAYTNRFDEYFGERK